MKPKTAYETLAVRPDASAEDIESNYASLLAQLKSQKNLFNPADYNFKLDAVNQAYWALSTPEARAAYDRTQARPAAITSLATVPAALGADAAALALRVEAMSLRAEAIALRADAMSLQAAHPDTFASAAGPALAGRNGLFKAVPLLKKLAMLLGASVAIWVVLQLVLALFVHRTVDAASGAAANARDKAVVQEYYQTHGVRPANAAEADLLEAANRKADIEARKSENDARKAERDKAKLADDYRRFEEDARRRAEQVSRDLLYTENQAREQARREDEQQARALEYKKQQQEDAERRRIEAEQARWRDALRR